MLGTHSFYIRALSPVSRVFQYFPRFGGRLFYSSALQSEMVSHTHDYDCVFVNIIRVIRLQGH